MTTKVFATTITTAKDFYKCMRLLYRSKKAYISSAHMDHTEYISCQHSKWPTSSEVYDVSISSEPNKSLVYRLLAGPISP